MSNYPVNSTAKVYKDQSGNDVTLRQLIQLEPEWAHSRIKVLEALEAQQQPTDTQMQRARLQKLLVDKQMLVNHKNAVDKDITKETVDSLMVSIPRSEYEWILDLAIAAAMGASDE